MLDYPKNIDEFNKLPEIDRNELICKPLADWSNEWYESILPEKNKLSLKFPSWDKEFKGKLRSKLVPIIGYGGTKKSLLAQNIAFENIQRGLGRCIYSTMESGATEVINRFIDMAVEPQDGYNPHSELEYHNNKTKRIDAKDFYSKSIAPVFKDGLNITENTSMDSGKYDRLLTEFERKGKKIDILIVDGLSGLGGSGSETELYSRHSKELKDLSNKHKIMTFLICHVSKGGHKTDKDLSKLVRSSEKIIDNCDFYISASLFAEGEDEFNKINGNFRLVNKRGTGNILDVVYDFDKLRLLMEETELEPEQFNF